MKPIDTGAKDWERIARRRLAAALRPRRSDPIGLLEAGDLVGLHCNSYTRLATIFKLHTRRGLSRADTLILLGQEWSMCDDISQHRDLLRLLLPATTEPIMMEEHERAALAALPALVTIYRGADRGVNEDGLCWSLDRAVAVRFPFLNRYRAADPVLVTATVERERIIALKLDRNEAEVITTHAVVSSIEAIRQ